MTVSFVWLSVSNRVNALNVFPILRFTARLKYLHLLSVRRCERKGSIAKDLPNHKAEKHQ
jgi:hypothetical protein